MAPHPQGSLDMEGMDNNPGMLHNRGMVPHHHKVCAQTSTLCTLDKYNI